MLDKKVKRQSLQWHLCKLLGGTTVQRVLYPLAGSLIQRSSYFLVNMKNAKSSTINLIDLGKAISFNDQVQTHAGSNTEYKSKRLLIANAGFFKQNNTSCKHLLYIYLNILNVCESSHLLQQVCLKINEL